MGTRFHQSTLILVAVLAAGCDDSEPAEEGGIEPTLSSIQENIFTPKCTLASCHDPTFNAGQLVLTDGMSFAQLNEPVADANATMDGFEQVVAGDPEMSFLWVKLQPGLDARLGTLMPQGSSEGLPADDLAAIRQWIVDGAQDD